MAVVVAHAGSRCAVAGGGDIWWGKHQAQLLCIDAAKTGDITESGRLWSYPLERHCCSTPSIEDGLIYVADCGGKVHCVDAETGRPYWVHDANGEIWSSTFVADGKVYIGTRKGAIVPSQLKIEGKKMIPAEDFLRGYTDFPGSKIT